MTDLKEVLGQTQTHLIPIETTTHLAHIEAAQDFMSLKGLCEKEGYNLTIHSSFRSYETQLSIWNAKAKGKRALLDQYGTPLTFSSLSEEEVLFAILRWSALPGMSRHHWGTEFDIYDSNSLPCSEYCVQLTPDEVAPQGIFGPLHCFLDQLIDHGRSFNFYRPYKDDLGGVSPEKWHLSHYPTANKFQQTLSYEVFENFLSTLNPSQFELLDLVRAHSKDIYERFVINIHHPK